MVENSWKIELWSRLGALWAPSWRQDGPRVAPRVKINEKCLILVLPVGSEMEPKSEQNGKKTTWKIVEIFITLLDAKNHWKSTKIHSKMDPKMDEKTGLRAATQNIENVLPAKAGTLFLMFRGVPNPWKFDVENALDFECDFEIDFFRFCSEIWPKLNAKRDPKAKKKSMKM